MLAFLVICSVVFMLAIIGITVVIPKEFEKRIEQQKRIQAMYINLFQ